MGVMYCECIIVNIIIPLIIKILIYTLESCDYLAMFNSIFAFPDVNFSGASENVSHWNLVIFTLNLLISVFNSQNSLNFHESDGYYRHPYHQSFWNIL